MLFEGSREVFRHLIEKQRLLAVGDTRHNAIRPLLLILSGTMRGIYGGGQVIALERFGLTEVFDTVVGISTGAPTAAYFLAGQSIIGTSIYCEECTTSNFISLSRLTIDVDYITNVFRGIKASKALDQNAVVASRSQFFVGATCAETAEAILLDAKITRPDVAQAIRASIAIPGLTRGAVVIDGRRYLDGVGAHPLPIRFLLKRFQPTDILVLANCSKNEREGFMRRSLWGLLAAQSPQVVREAFMSRPIRFVDELQYLRTQNVCRMAVLWSDNEIGALERNPKKLIAAKERAEQHLSSLLTEIKGLT